MPKIPDDPLAFIQRCVRERRIYWTYHVNMRLAGRYIARNDILGAVGSYEIVESYPDDKYLPSYLVLAEFAESSFHILFAADVEDGNVRIVTAYRPDPNEWWSDFRNRRTLP
jgi:uncharacterized protein DUF4258